MTHRATFRLAVRAAAATAVLAGAFPGLAGAQSPFMSGQGMPYAAFDALPKTDLRVKGGVIHVGFAPGALRLSHEQVFAWVRRSANAVSTYYGRFPVKSARLLIVPTPGAGVQGGTTWGYNGAAMRVPLGRNADKSDLDVDWVMTHEMTHLALPDVGEGFSWLSEGLAVYVEPVARVQAGDLSAETIFADMVRDMPKGLPRAGDGGLDRVGSWGRIYWGGALFCLVADVEIRKRTGNRLGLQDAMRGVLAAGGDNESEWPDEKIFATADRTVGQTVLRELYASMGGKAVSPDLPALWRDLGVKADGGAVVFDDDAPLAGVRKAIVRPPA